MKVIRRALFFIVFAFFAALTVQNMPALSASVPLKLLNATPIQMPLIMWLIITFACGFLLCYAFDLKKAFNNRKEKKKLVQENADLKLELDQHRNKFLSDSSKKTPEVSDESP